MLPPFLGYRFFYLRKLAGLINALRPRGILGIYYLICIRPDWYGVPGTPDDGYSVLHPLSAAETLRYIVGQVLRTLLAWSQ